MAGSTVIPLRPRDEALEEEARTAGRLVQSIRAGDAAAADEMVQRYSRGLEYLLKRRINDSELAREALQITFCVAAEKLRAIDLDQPERLAGYLRGIAIRVAKAQLRKAYKSPFPVDDKIIAAIPDYEPGQFEQVSREQTRAAIQKLLDSMPVYRDREILKRFYLLEHDKQDICGALNLSSLHFNRVLHRAKARFRKILEESADLRDFGLSNSD